MAASVERGSEHPIGVGDPGGRSGTGARVRPVAGFVARAGLGVEATGRGQPRAIASPARHVIAGTARLLAERGIELGAARRIVEPMAGAGRTAVLVAVDGRPAGLIALADPVRPEAAEAVAALSATGIEVWLVSGDRRRGQPRPSPGQVGIPLGPRPGRRPAGRQGRDGRGVPGRRSAGGDGR